MAKGTGPVLGYGFAAGLITAGDEPIGAIRMLQWLAVGVAAVLGHVFPIFLKFKGGKGVATSAGALFGFWPVLAVPALARSSSGSSSPRRRPTSGWPASRRRRCCRCSSSASPGRLGYAADEIAVCGG